MDRKYNNVLIDPNGELNKGKIFFVQRWWELLDHSTYDNHHVNAMNLHIILNELYKTCKAVVSKDTKKWHLRSIVDEARENLLKDPVIKKHGLQYFELLIKLLQNTPDQEKEIYKLSLQLNYIIKYLEERYIKWLVTDLNKELDGDNFELIDSLLNCLISELIYRGWSTNTLYTAVNKNDFYKVNYWRNLLSGFLKRKEEFSCIIRIKNEMSEKFRRASELIGLKIVKGDEILEEFSSIGDLSERVAIEAYYFKDEVEAFEWNSAIKEYLQRFVNNEDALRFYGYKIPQVENAIIISHQTKEYRPNVRLPEFKSILAPVTQEKPLEYAEKLPPNLQLNMQRVFRYCRQAEESPSAESCFLNIWVALESFTKTEKFENDESDFNKIEYNVSSSVANGYIYNLVRYFLADCKRCRIPIENHISFTGNNHQDVNSFITVILDSDKSEAIMRDCESINILLNYRFAKLIDLIRKPEEVSKKIRKHSQRVRWHLQRMYRVRNSIVHSANHENHNLELLIRHLNSYLKYTVNGAIFTVYRTSSSSFDEVFAMIKQNSEATTEILKDNTLVRNKHLYLKFLVDGALFS